MVDIKKDDVPVIYKQDIMNDEGKLNTLGTLFVIGVFVAAIQAASKYLFDCIIDKDKVS